MISKLRKQFNDIYGYALLLDIARFKEGIEHERREEIASRAKPVQYYLPK